MHSSSEIIKKLLKKIIIYGKSNMVPHVLRNGVLVKNNQNIPHSLICI